MRARHHQIAPAAEKEMLQRLGQRLVKLPAQWILSDTAGQEMRGRRATGPPAIEHDGGAILAIHLRR